MISAPESSVVCIVLAAGRGRRMGMPKLACEANGHSFLEQILSALEQADCRRIAVVVSEETKDYADSLHHRFSVSVNPAPERGMLSSIHIGMQDHSSASGYLLFPVDHPFVKPATIRTLCSEFTKHPDAVIKPVYQERSGHPIIFSQAIRDYLILHPEAENLRTVIHESGVQQIFLPVHDEGILRNINTPEDLHFL